MTIFDPEQNTAIAMYGPPGYVDDTTRIDIELEPTPFVEESFFDKIAALFKKVLDFIKGLFVRN